MGTNDTVTDVDIDLGIGCIKHLFLVRIFKLFVFSNSQGGPSKLVERFKRMQC